MNGAPFDRSTMLTALRLSKGNLTALTHSIRLRVILRTNRRMRKIEGERLNRLNILNARNGMGFLQGGFWGASKSVEMALNDFSAFPGGELIQRGLEDLAAGRESEAALLILIGAPRLRRLGLNISEVGAGPPEHRLYDLLVRSDPDAAHSRYNALIRSLVRFERAVECVA